MKTKGFLCVIMGLLAVTGCSSSDGGSSQTAAALAFSQAQSKLEELSNLSPAPVSTSMTVADVSPRATGLTAIWNSTNLGFMDQRQDPSVATSLKNYMGLQFEEDAVRQNGSSINVFGRIKNAASIICIVTNSLSAATSASLTTAEPATITFNEATKSVMVNTCGFATADLQNLPASATMTFSAASPTTIFDLKISLDFGGESQEMYAKWGGTDGVIAFASNEDNDNGRTRSIVIYNSLTGLLRAEYLGKSKINGFGMTIDRLYKNESTGVARVMSVWNGNYSDATSDTTPNDSLMYIVDGNTNDSSGTHLSFGISFSGYASGNGTYEACVQKSDGSTVDVSSVTANQFTCSNTGGTGGRATGYVTIVSNFTSQSVGGSPTWHLFSTAPNLSWTTPDAMLTTNVNAP